MRPVFFVLALLGLSFVPVSLFAQTSSLWTLSQTPVSGPALPSLVDPELLSSSTALQVNAGVLDSLLPGQRYSLAVAAGQEAELTVHSRERFANGDRSWLLRGSNDMQLVLTASPSVLQGKLQLAGSKYDLKAVRQAGQSEFAGWLYSYRADLQIRPHDLAGVDLAQTGKFRDVLALSDSDVSIEQTLSDEYPKVGDLLTVDVSVRNNLSSSISNEEVTVYFILEDSSLVSLDSPCNSSSSSGQPTIECLIPALAPGASFEFSYTVRLNDSAYPFTSSAVFVGDVFDANDHVRDDAFIYALKDTLSDSDSDGISDFNETLSLTDPQDFNSRIADEDLPVIDLMFLYTDRFAAELDQLSAETEINHLVATTNSYYLNSGALVRFRPIYYGQVNYDLQDSLDGAFTALQSSQGVFADTLSLRDQLGADIVVLIDGKIGSENSCGLGSLPGRGFNGELFHPYGYSSDLFVTLYAPGFDQNGGCDEETLAHELGHNLGLAHSRRDSGAQGALNWAHGYGIDGQFSTIMAYASRFPGAENLPLFSTPDSTECNGLACGVSRDDLEQGADAVHAINHSRFQVAAIRDSRVLDVASLDPEQPSALLMFGGASSNGVDKSSFAPSESIDVNATLTIPGEHVGETGNTYVVIAVAGAGLFYVDSDGAYQSWNGEFSTLGSYSGERALNSTEELTAFSNFVPASFTVSGISVQVFFAYSVSEPYSFVYSSEGISFSIQ
ncbi:MAG: M12 family metallo-peptidase [Pseudomonadales bacterium]|nr:M12 family metallo-peptidase [Pseudomonadales bacterium]